jgi:hypothetical protein
MLMQVAVLQSTAMVADPAGLRTAHFGRSWAGRDIE